MVKRVIIIDGTYAEAFENSINNFLKSTPGKIHEIKFNFNEDTSVYHAFIVFTPEGEYEMRSKAFNGMG